MSRPTGNVEIPISVLASVDTLDELEDWLLAHQPRAIEQLRLTRKDDLAGKFRPWEPTHVKWPTKSK
jgi:hypothetical protein